MAKKKPTDDQDDHTPGKKAADRRRATLQYTDLMIEFGKLNEQVKVLKTTLLAMQSRKITAVRVDGATKLTRGNVFIREFNGHLQQGLSRLDFSILAD